MIDPLHPEHDPIIIDEYLTNAMPQKQSNLKYPETLVSCPGSITKISRSRSTVELQELNSVWTNIGESVPKGDDFFCFPENKDKLIPEHKASHKRKSSILIVPAQFEKDEKSEDSDEDADVDFEQFKKFIKPVNNGSASKFSSAVKELKRMIELFLKDLGNYLRKSSEKSDELCNVTFDPELTNRKYYIIQKLKQKYELKKLHHIVKSFQGKIRQIASFQDFLSQFENEPSAVDLKCFNQTILNKESKAVQKTAKEISRVSALLVHTPKAPSNSNEINWEIRFTSMKEKSGRILQKCKMIFGQMTYYDIEVILKAITPPRKEKAISIRQIIFNLAWEQFWFPFSEINETNLPDILDLTPKIFHPPFLDEVSLNTPFNILNSIKWPLKNESESLFSLLIETDPFVIADIFWDLIGSISSVITNLAVKSGKKLEDVEVGFDDLFKYFLVIVFSFGVSEVLDVMKYVSSFYDFAGGNSHRQFVMTHFNAIVKYISEINSDEWHNKFAVDK